MSATHDRHPPPRWTLWLVLGVLYGSGLGYFAAIETTQVVHSGAERPKAIAIYTPSGAAMGLICGFIADSLCAAWLNARYRKGNSDHFETTLFDIQFYLLIGVLIATIFLMCIGNTNPVRE